MGTLRPFLALFLAAGPAAAQLPPRLVSSERIDALTGLYVMDDGRLVHLTNVGDQAGGRPILTVTEYAAGRARALWPQADSGFAAGPAWFRREPVAFRVRFDERARPAASLTWAEDGRTMTGRRAPLAEREVTIANGDVRLAGVLVLPPRPGPHPALLLVQGSGPETRRIPRQVADLLAWNGVAVLVTDKRGTGGSTGNWNGLAPVTWAGDVDAELDWLRRQPEVDPSRVALYGNSESGYVVPMVAARRSDLRFLVCRVCPVLPGPTTLIDAHTGTLRAEGMAEPEIAAAMDLYGRLIRYALDRTGYDSLVAYAAQSEGRPWRARYAPQPVPAREAPYWDNFRRMLEADPAPDYRRVRVPVLVILGERDDRVLVERHRPAYEALAREGLDLTLWVIPGVDHGLMNGGVNATGYPPDLHARIVDWITAAFDRPVRSGER